MMGRPMLAWPTNGSPARDPAIGKEQAMSTYPPLSTRVIGQTEKTLNAILDRQLAGTGLTEPQWVILTLAVTSGGTVERDQFTRQVAGALKIGAAQAPGHIPGMVAPRQPAAA